MLAPLPLLLLALPLASALPVALAATLPAALAAEIADIGRLAELRGDWLAAAAGGAIMAGPPAEGASYFSVHRRAMPS